MRLQGELAHVVRVTTMGELAASIAHEVNQPLAAVTTNASAYIRWLAAEPPNIEESRACVTHILRDGQHAADVRRRIRRFLKKVAQQHAPQEVNQLIREVLAVTGEALRSHGVQTAVDLQQGFQTSWATASSCSRWF